MPSLTGRKVQNPYNPPFCFILSTMYYLLTAIPILLLLTQSVAAASVPIQKVDTGNTSLDHRITNFYKCVSDTHKDPPPISKVNDCYFSNVGTETGFQPEFIPSFSFHHFDEQPPSIIVHSFNGHHFFVFHHHDGIRILTH